MNNQFYIFYNYAENIITDFINTDNNVRNIISIEDQKKHILQNAFTHYEYNTDNVMNMLNNNLSLYLQIVEFVRFNESPYMPGVIDFTKVKNVFNRFMYHYAKQCMNDQTSSIYIRILNIQYAQH
jgi:hypothetical protein